MFQNVKVDIIYYKTNTDFEMEFNLCGCCRMRLLTDKSPDRKTAVHSLARAVSRSRVIMMVGPLFGNDGIMKLCSGALKTELSPLDNKTYGINTAESIEILKNSTPHITPEGYFGGCIIESGPQTMILISDNKNIRKSIMLTLIHPYIKEMCANELTQDINSHSIDETETTSKPQTEAETEKSTIEAAEEEILETADETDSVATDEEDLVLEEPEREDEFIPDLLLEQAIDDDIELTEDGELAGLIHMDDSDLEEDNSNDLNDGYDNTIEDEAAGFIFGDEEEKDEGQSTYDESYEETSAFYTDEDEDIKNIADDIALSAQEAMIKGIISDADEDYEDIDEFEDIEESPEDMEETFRFIRQARFMNMPIAIIIALLLVVLAVACYCIFYVPAKNGIPASEYLNDIFNTLFG